MILRIQSGGLSKPPEYTTADSLVIMTDDNTPIAIALMYGGGVFIKTADDDDFEETLKFLGLNDVKVPATHPLVIPKGKQII